MVECAERRGIHLIGRQDFRYHFGRGVEARVDGQTVLVGNLDLMRESLKAVDGAATRIEQRLQDEGKSPVFVAVDGKLAGAIAYTDPFARNPSV